MAASAVQSLTIYPLAVPMRRKVHHASCDRSVADPVVVAVELNSHVVGYGETLARSYVTAETTASVMDAIRRVYLDVLLRLHPDSFPEALEAVENLPWQDENGREIPAARAAIELALLDAYSRHFQRPITEVCGWMGLHAFASTDSIRKIRFSGVLATGRMATLRRQTRLLWLCGIRDFKVKVGDDGDDHRLRWVWRYLRSATTKGRSTIRIDANGAWSINQAVERLHAWQDIPLVSVEQPLAKDADSDLPALKAQIETPVLHDESLVTVADAQRLIDAGVADAFNIRISKCGGLLPSLRIADLARRNGVLTQLGCMVGETSILSAAARRFLEMVPGVRFAEGNFGTLLLRDDVVRRPLRFGFRGKVSALANFGWGVTVEDAKLNSLTLDEPCHIHL